MRKITLPKAMLILISNRILDNPVFVVECSEGLMRWLLDEIDEIIKFQKKHLPAKSKKHDEPRVYILKALPKPQETRDIEIFKGVRRKFNNKLQDVLKDYPSFGFINVHEITTRKKDEKFFLSPNEGELSDEGIIQFWESISQTIKAMDQGNRAKTTTLWKETQVSEEDIKRATHNFNREKPAEEKPYRREARRYSGERRQSESRHFQNNTYYAPPNNFYNREYHDNTYYWGYPK